MLASSTPKRSSQALSSSSRFVSSASRFSKAASSSGLPGASFFSSDIEESEIVFRRGSPSATASGRRNAKTKIKRAAPQKNQVQNCFIRPLPLYFQDLRPASIFQQPSRLETVVHDAVIRRRRFVVFFP